VTYFKKGDRVVARESHQGLVQGATYEVVEVKEQATPFGNFVTYFLVLDHVADPSKLSKLQASSYPLAIANGHLLLRAV